MKYLRIENTDPVKTGPDNAEVLSKEQPKLLLCTPDNDCTKLITYE